LAETLSIADHIIMIANGRVAFEGAPDAMQASDDPLVSPFLTGCPDGPVRFHYPAPTLGEQL
jgi:phospholipid/cholesterol/gamma-HCH transport system ATP-binding protein